MSKARLFQDYLIPGSAENENVLITDYWLEFVAARDEREPAPGMKLSEEDIREKLQEFQQQMNAVIRNNESLRQALAADHFDSSVSVPPGPELPGVHLSWASRPGPPKNLPGQPLSDQYQEEDGEYDSLDEQRSLPPKMLSTLLLKILGK